MRAVIETGARDCYEYRECLGEGAFGTIYKVYHKELKQEFALKVYKNLEQFHNEVQMWKAAVEMPGMVEVYDFFEANGTGCLAMEYLTGGSLKDRLLKQPGKRFSTEEALEILTPVMQTLVRMHAKGIVHCDISPDNVMFDASGKPKLIDLGAAKILGKEKKERMLKTQYAAPEQFANPEKIGPWTDVYEICALLYVMISGKNIPEATKRVHQDDLKELGFWADGVEQAETAIMRGLHMEIQKRYFQLELFMQACGINTESVSHYNEEIRRQWGDLWISISAQGRFAAGAKKQKISSKKRKKIVRTLLFTVILGSGAVIGVRHYKNELTEVSFWLKLKLAQVSTKQEDDTYLFTSTEKDFAEKLNYLQENGTLYYEDQEYISYKIEEAEFMDWGCENNYDRKMYLDQAALYEICCFYLDLDQEKVEEISGDFSSSVYWYLSVVERLEINVKSSWEYRWADESLKISYDPMDDRAFCVEFQTYDKGKAEVYLEKVLPFCCPEAYLEATEIEKIFSLADAGESSALCLNEKSWIYAETYQMDEKTRYSCRTAASRSALW